LKATVVGSLWASVEIIIGSFLHNLRIPFTGAILSFIGVYLLVACSRIWKEKGFIWRAGVICALMKSISPSAVILGPMIGILTEAIILEFIFFVFGKNLLSYMLGGALAVFSTLVHKVVSLLILYGFDFITILDALYRFGVKQINLSQLSPVYLLIVITAIYMVAGMVAAVSGYRSGVSFLNIRKISSGDFNFTLQQPGQLFPQNAHGRYSVVLLIFNLLMVILCMLLINFNFIVAALIVSSGYFVFCLLRYRSAMKRFINSMLLIQFFIITLVASFLWSGFTGDTFFSPDGFLIGLRMIFRAIIVITGYAAISVELKNPLIKSIMYRKGFSSLYQSLGLAFSALPGIIATMPRSKELFKKASLSFSGLFNKAEILLQLFEKEDSARPSIIIITGETGEGKTTFVSKLVEILTGMGIRTGGFLAPAVMENGKRTGFNIFDISGGSLVEICSIVVHDNWMRTGKYYFNPDGLAHGRQILSPDNLIKTQLVVIDEIGPLEINNMGWASAIETLCRKSIIPQIWVVRKSLVYTAARKWPVGNVLIFDIKNDSAELVISKITDILIPPSESRSDPSL